MANFIREYHRAPTLAHAWELLQRPETSTTALVFGPRLPDSPYAQHEAVVDLQALGLNTVVGQGNTIRIGALAPLQSLVESPLLATVADGIVAHAAAFIRPFWTAQPGYGGRRHRRRDRRPAGPPEVLLALLALGAKVTCMGETMLSHRRYPAIVRHHRTFCRKLSSPTQLRVMARLARVARSPLDQAIVAAVARLSPMRLPAWPWPALDRNRWSSRQTMEI